MAKIIKVGSQSPTFTSHGTKKASPIHTHRNSNEATNPFKFTNFEGNTLQFADVFEGFNPSFKANKMRMVASSVAGTMNKIRSSFEPIVNFVKRVRENVSHAWGYASTTSFSAAMSDAATATATAIKNSRAYKLAGSIKESSIYKRTDEILNTPIHIPVIDSLSEKMSGHISAVKGSISSRIESASAVTTNIGKDMSARWESILSKFRSGNKYMGMEVTAIENAWKEEIALGGAI